jgi:hypothetical protein
MTIFKNPDPTVKEFLEAFDSAKSEVTHDGVLVDSHTFPCSVAIDCVNNYDLELDLIGVDVSRLSCGCGSSVQLLVKDTQHTTGGSGWTDKDLLIALVKWQHSVIQHNGSFLALQMGLIDEEQYHEDTPQTKIIQSATNYNIVEEINRIKRLVGDIFDTSDYADFMHVHVHYIEEQYEKANAS